MDEDKKKSKLFVIIMAVIVIGLIIIGFILTWFIVRDGMSESTAIIDLALTHVEPLMHHR